jgi:hypothetical protein
MTTARTPLPRRPHLPLQSTLSLSYGHVLVHASPLHAAGVFSNASHHALCTSSARNPKASVKLLLGVHTSRCPSRALARHQNQPIRLQSNPVRHAPVLALNVKAKATLGTTRALVQQQSLAMFAKMFVRIYSRPRVCARSRLDYVLLPLRFNSTFCL